jgi:hypothetical protein
VRSTLPETTPVTGIYLGFEKGVVPSFKKGHLLAKWHPVRPRQCFRDMSKGQGDPLGILFDKTGFWTPIECDEG